MTQKEEGRLFFPSLSIPLCCFCSSSSSISFSYSVKPSKKGRASFPVVSPYMLGTRKWDHVEETHRFRFRKADRVHSPGLMNSSILKATRIRMYFFEAVWRRPRVLHSACSPPLPCWAPNFGYGTVSCFARGDLSDSQIVYCIPRL